MTPEIIQRINTLAHKKKSIGLTDEELAEQAKLRRIYLDNIKDQLKSTLDNVEIVDKSAESTFEAGTDDPVRLPKFRN